MPRPEDIAREKIDALLEQAGWSIQNADEANIYASTGVAIRKFPLEAGYGIADYLLYVNGEAVGVIEAKKEGMTLTGVEVQSGKYSEGLPESLPAPIRPLPFLYQSTGIETRFTNRLEPDPRSRNVFAFHRPETFAAWLEESVSEVGSEKVAFKPSKYVTPRMTFLGRMQNLRIKHWGRKALGSNL